MTEPQDLNIQHKTPPKSKNPSKKKYRPRAHVSPITYFDMHTSRLENIQFLDIGCGYGAFLLHLARKYPEKEVLGIEIRDKVKEYVQLTINNSDLKNASVVKSNCMLFLPEIIEKGSIEKLFILYPDPMFKKKDRKYRIICFQMIFVYKYILNKCGKIYVSTDVVEYFDEMVDILQKDSSFEQKLIIKYEYLDNEWKLKHKEGEFDDISDAFVLGTDEARRAGLKNQTANGAIFERRMI